MPRLRSSAALFAFVVSSVLGGVDTANGFPPPGRGFGGPPEGRGFGGPPEGRGPGAGRGFGRDEAWAHDHDAIHALFEGRDRIRRTVTDIPHGVRTVTETDDAKLRAVLVDHVTAMKKRLDSGRAIRRRDPLFAAIFDRADAIEMQVERTEKGIRVTVTSKDPYAVLLVRAHARVVSLFVKNGHDEAHRNHAVPKTESGGSDSEITDETAAFLEETGPVVPMPRAADQPRPDTKIVVDVTTSGDPKERHPVFTRLARYRNLYLRGGARPARVQIVAVLHGGATTTVLTDAAYARAHGVDANPNAKVLDELRRAGVEFVVCGQSLAKKSFTAKDVRPAAAVGLSAFTSVVNRQLDGYVLVRLP